MVGTAVPELLDKCPMRVAAAVGATYRNAGAAAGVGHLAFADVGVGGLQGTKNMEGPTAGRVKPEPGCPGRSGPICIAPDEDG